MQHEKSITASLMMMKDHAENKQTVRSESLMRNKLDPFGALLGALWTEQIMRSRYECQLGEVIKLVEAGYTGNHPGRV